MALKGKIDDFGIAEIFQLIGQQQRTGILTIRRINKIAEILFVNGMISKATPLYRSPKRDPLGDSVVKARLVTEKGLQRALKKQEETLKSLEEALLDLKLLSQEQIQNVNDTLILETLYDVLKWNTGDYEFTIKEIDHDERFSNLMSIEHILLDVFRMIDEEPELSRRIPHYDIILQKTSPGEESMNIEEELGTYEQIIYNFVDGTNPVQTIIDQSLMGRFNTTKALVNLLDGGYIKKTSVGRVTPQKVISQKNLLAYISYGALPIILILLLIGLRLIIKTPASPDDTAYYFPKKAIGRSQFLKIKNALNVYFLENGRFPVSLEDLVEVRLMRAEELNFPSGVQYNYYLQKDGNYRLE